MLQCVVMCFSVLQCVAMCCSACMQDMYACACLRARVLICVCTRTATHYNKLQHTATDCNRLQHTTTHCNTLQRTATHCNALQHTATHCNTWQHITTCKYATTQVCCGIHDGVCTPHVQMKQNTAQIRTTRRSTEMTISCKFQGIKKFLDSVSPHMISHMFSCAHCNTLQHTATHCSSLP